MTAKNSEVLVPAYRFINWNLGPRRDYLVVRKRVRAFVWNYHGIEFFCHKRNKLSIVTHSFSGRKVLSVSGDFYGAMKEAKVIVDKNLTFLKNFKDEHCPAN